MKYYPIALAFLLAAWALFPLGATANPARDGIMAKLAAEAKAADPAFTAFSAERGKAFYLAKQTGGKPDQPSCTTCHTESAKQKGQTRAGKPIDPLAVSVAPDRFTDPDKVDLWFKRNCTGVLGRVCTAREKGDFLAFAISQ